jgi:hypothetical protein
MPRRFSRFLHVFGGPAVHPGWIAVAPHLWRGDGLMSPVKRIASCLPDEMRADRAARQTVVA